MNVGELMTVLSKFDRNMQILVMCDLDSEQADWIDDVRVERTEDVGDPYEMEEEDKDTEVAVIWPLK